MTKFININNEIAISISEIETIERKLFDLRESAFKAIDAETSEVFDLDYKEFVLAEITLKSKKVIEVTAVVYSDDDYHKEINEQWANLIEHLDSKPVTL